MATELGKAYVQIIPSAKGIGNAISSELGGEAMSAGKSMGSNIVGAIKGAIVAAGIGETLRSALEAGGNLQQSFGGIETLYGDAADAAKKYAVEAAQAGISANTYAEQAVSFGAALKSAFGGDVTQAAEAANTAILDMADNSAKMGTDITAIQTAYAGFSKQNYTMLDNLKLGYGGTKSEMERLLADAEKLSGVHYDIENLGDVYSAIHVIQEDLGLTGVAAAEASSTLTGSFGAVKAAAENLMANMALGEDIKPALNTLSASVKTFLLNNLFPMVGNLLQSLPDLVSGAGSFLIGFLNQISNSSGQIAQIGISLVTELVQAIVEATPYLVEAAWNIIASLGKALVETDWISIGTNMLSELRNSLDLAAGEILGQDSATVEGFVSGILSNIPALYESATEIINSFYSYVLDNAPTLLSAGADMLLSVVQGILDNLPDIIASVITMMGTFTRTTVEHLPQILQVGIQIIGKLVAGIITAIPKIIAALPKIFMAFTQTFAGYDWKKIGSDILEGIKKGILDAISSVVEAAKAAAKSIFDAVKGFFKIESPSKLMMGVGEMIDAGMALGITDNKDLIDDAVAELAPNAMTQLKTSMSVAPVTTGGTLEKKIDDLYRLLGMYLPEIADGQHNITLEGDAGRLFRLMQRESVRNTQLVGKDSVLSAI